MKTENYKNVYYAYREFYDEGKLDIHRLRVEEDAVLHWARMNICRKLDLDVWEVDCEFDLANLLTAYHFHQSTVHVIETDYPCVIKFKDVEMIGAAVRFEYEIIKGLK